MTPFIKIRFTSKEHGNTAGLVFPVDAYEKLSVTELSRFFPYSEALKMKRIDRSPSYETWEQAFFHEF